MKVLLIGSGAREHAILHKISQCERVKKIFVAPGNGGMSTLAECVPIDVQKIDELLLFAKQNQIDLTIVGPEWPLTHGIVDAFQKEKLACFGPSARASLIEGSKVFTKEFCSRHNIPTATSATFSDATSAQDYLKNKNTWPIVIKADGLAQGKGVIIAQDLAEGLAAIRELLVQKKFGDASEKIIIEDFLQGREISFFVLTDGENFVELPPAQDHKRIFNDDKGPNTGGMGAFSSSALVNEKLRERIIEKIIRPTLDGLKKEDRRFSGFLFTGLMIDKLDEPFVIEYNCRLGDPETCAILPLLDENLISLIEDALSHKLKTRKAKIKNQSSVTVVLASQGYPENYKKGFLIEGLSEKMDTNGFVYHAGTVLDETGYKTNGGRVLAVTAISATLAEAIRDVYVMVGKISWPGFHYRTDIAKKGLLL